MILITGGSGFIGCNFIHSWLVHNTESIVNVDNLTYASNNEYLAKFSIDQRYHFVQADVADLAKMQQIMHRYQPRAIIHLAAESHVDRSIAQPAPFVQTNVQGCFALLQASLVYWQTQPLEKQQQFRFIYVSTDEVFGSLSASDAPVTEQQTFAPSNPYSATKAAAEHLVRAWHKTYALPCIITHSSNNYGAYQYPEKLIPVVIKRALQRKKLPIYGNGQQIRDWLYVQDHCQALQQLLLNGKVGEVYNIGGNCEITNLELVQQICSILDELSPANNLATYQELIEFVTDRPGHDWRYSLNSNKIKQQLGWQAQTVWQAGLLTTVQWYLKHFSNN